MIIRASTSFLSEAEAGAENSKKVRAERGRRMALMPKAVKMVAKTLAAMRREGEWEMRQGLMLGGMGREGWMGSIGGQRLVSAFAHLFLS